ncbi:MAG: nucleotidyltransferase [Desulfuromonadales bacterium]
MHVVGLITEYNPFHNGHLHHLQKSLHITGAEASVAVMSGHFLQRGEPALVDKWVRTEMALAAGVDLVFELPFPFACNSAPHFALGGVRSLAALGVVDALCFGSESGRLERLDRIAEILVAHQRTIEDETAVLLREGLNYPAARETVLKRHAALGKEDELGLPNNILGIEYLKALRIEQSGIRPDTIPRRGAGYHETHATGPIASASAIRARLSRGEAVDALIPESCGKILAAALHRGHCADSERLFLALQAQLLQDEDRLQNIYMVEDGIDRRLSRAALEARDFAEMAKAVKSRQWTLTRIQRMLMYVLMQARKGDMEAFVQSGPLYLRLLGHTAKGRSVLARMRRRKTLPVIGDPARSQQTLGRFYQDRPETRRLAEEMLRYDLRATRLYSLLCKSFPGEARNQDFYQPVRQV